MTEQDKGRVAIKFGPASSSTKPSPRPSASSSLGKRPRPPAFGGHDSDDSDVDEHGRRRSRGQHEAITEFGSHGAETERKRQERQAVRKELVIQRQPNRDWRAEVKAQKRGKNLPPEEARGRQNGHVVEREPADQDRQVQWGLTVTKTKNGDDDAKAVSTSPPAESLTRQDEAPPGQPQAPARTADDEAMDVLLGRASTAGKAIPRLPLSEDDAYRRDAAAAGAESTLDDYEAMPVEEFGAALLRGMGWDGEPRGPRPKEVRRRANRLGLGAKELNEAEDLGGWAQAAGASKRRPRLDEYRREESRRKEGRRNEHGYKRERERHGHSDRNGDVHRDRHRDHDRDRRR